MFIVIDVIGYFYYFILLLAKLRNNFEYAKENGKK